MILMRLKSAFTATWTIWHFSMVFISFLMGNKVLHRGQMPYLSIGSFVDVSKSSIFEENTEHIRFLNGVSFETRNCIRFFDEIKPVQGFKSTKSRKHWMSSVSKLFILKWKWEIEWGPRFGQNRNDLRSSCCHHSTVSINAKINKSAHCSRMMLVRYLCQSSFYVVQFVCDIVECELIGCDFTLMTIFISICQLNQLLACLVSLFISFVISCGLAHKSFPTPHIDATMMMSRCTTCRRMNAKKKS